MKKLKTFENYFENEEVSEFNNIVNTVISNIKKLLDFGYSYIEEDDIKDKINQILNGMWMTTDDDNVKNILETQRSEVVDEVIQKLKDEEIL